MKKIARLTLWMLVFTLIVTAFAACGTPAAPTTSATASATVSAANSSSASQSSASPKTSTSASKAPLKAAMITPQKLGDDGPIDACYAGLQKGSKDFGYEIKLLEPESGEYEDSIRAMCDEGYNLIFCIFSQVQDALSRVAPEYPNVHFVQILGDLKADNVKTLNFKDQEASFLSGIVAANMTTTGKVAVIAGAPVGDNVRNIAGFEAGVKEAKPNVGVKHLYVGSFEDPTKGKELANTLLNDGYDIILEVCASSSMGIREAIKEKGGKTYMIGNCVDESKAIPGQVPCSNFTNYGNWFYSCMKEVAEGSFKTGVISQGLADNAVDCVFAADDVMKVPQEIKDLVAKYKQKIIKGEIVPPTELKE